MSFSVDVLANIAIELQRGIGHQDRFQRLITTLRQVLECDASALLRYDSRQFIPLAIDGLAKDVLGRRFALEGHPRLEAIARAGDVVRFPADSELPDPYDGLIPGQESLKVHACVGLPLFAGQNLIGALTLDGMQPDQFDVFSDEELRLIAALAAGALSNALLIEQLESQNMLPGEAAPFEAVKQTQMIGLSPGMTQLKKEIEIVAASDLNVLISGETGTGKELVAKAIHEASPRAVNPLVYLNCAALPESVAESELFGHVKGAFTGAISNRSGKFEMADNGTLFLDEIGDMPLMLQAKLLRAIEAREILPIGASSPIQVDIRIISATNQNLAQFIAEGKFREDLFYRLNVIPITLPPLRERQEDIELLVHYFLHLHTRRLGSVYPGIAPDVVEILRKHRWPGNLRELSNLMEYLVNVVPSGEVIDSTLLPPNLLNNGTTEQSDVTEVSEAHLSLDDAGGTALEEMEKQMIREALSRHNSKKEVADELGIGIATLYRKIKKYELLNT